jgi:hypothetical protein
VADEGREGFFAPEYCPRSRADCRSLAQIIAIDHQSFVCCGERESPPEARAVPQDAYRFCHKSIEGVDVIMDHDERDMAHIAAVYSWATASTMPCHGEPRVRVLPAPSKNTTEAT